MIVIDGLDALLLMRRATAEHPDRVAPDRYTRNIIGTTIRGNDVPCCMVGTGLALAGVPLHRLDCPGDVYDLARELADVADISPVACSIFMAAQATQDGDSSWTDALFDAETEARSWGISEENAPW